MDEQAVRQIVRQVLAKHGGQTGAAIGASPQLVLRHASHYRYLLPESDGPCIIEPSVQCNHCGYCESHGH